MCGGTDFILDCAAFRSGLSPRVRGNHCRPPAWPGRQRVYPRVCGGTRLRRRPRFRRRGLSPRVRGNQSGLHQAGRRERSIPACAGEPGGLHQLVQAGTVYPRVCGGTVSSASRTSRGGGLSPRVRGNPHQRPPVGLQIGSIPACAGEPCGGSPTWRAMKVYPRVCGGTDCEAGILTDEPGLSPRVRGNPVLALRTMTLTRSIPACAGEPRPARGWQSHQGVYPRVCGGTQHGRTRRVHRRGLSPRVRGNPRPGIAGCRRFGSIPACAGEPNAGAVADSRLEVYPRVCGGTRCRLAA